MAAFFGDVADSRAAVSGLLFGAGTPAAGVAPGTAIGTVSPATVYNPANSGVRIFIRKVSWGFLSGTLGAGTTFHCINPTTNQAAPTAGTQVTPLNLDAGGAAVAKGQFFSGSTVVAGTAIRPFVALLADTTSSTGSIEPVTENVGEEICLEPGTSYQLQSIAGAGTTPLVFLGVTWKEVSIS